MPGNPQETFARIRNNLTRLDQQPLGKNTLLILLFLDFFILSSIFDGLAVHTRQLSAPEDSIPATCREIVLDQEWNPANRVEKLASAVRSRPDGVYQREEKSRPRHPLCAPYLELLDQIKSDRQLVARLEERDRLDRDARKLQREIGNQKGAYDTSLLESVARPQAEPAGVETIGQEIRARSEALNALVGQRQALETEIDQNATVALLWKRVQNQPADARDSLRAEWRRLRFWYPVKRLGMELLFLLPLVAVFYLWNAGSIRKKRGVQTLVSSHLLVVSAIPVLFKLLETVYDIIPKTLLKKFIALLESLKLVAIWHYLVMALAVAAALFLIYLFQKKLFSREKLTERRIAKGQCQQCGKPLPKGAAACVFCGFQQFKTCPACGKPTPVFGKHCQHCGTAQ